MRYLALTAIENEGGENREEKTPVILRPVSLDFSKNSRPVFCQISKLHGRNRIKRKMIKSLRYIQGHYGHVHEQDLSKLMLLMCRTLPLTDVHSFSSTVWVWLEFWGASLSGEKIVSMVGTSLSLYWEGVANHFLTLATYSATLLSLQSNDWISATTLILEPYKLKHISMNYRLQDKIQFYFKSVR